MGIAEAYTKILQSRAPMMAFTGLTEELAWFKDAPNQPKPRNYYAEALAELNAEFPADLPEHE